MPRYDCPSCGQPFNGKKCRACGYESFSEEIAHRLHVHKGEPLVIKDTSRKPIPKADPFGCPGKPSDKTAPRKKKSSLLSVLILLLCFLSPILKLVQTVGEKASDYIESHYTSDTPTEETSDVSTLLYSGNGIRIYADWADDYCLDDSLPLLIYNNNTKSIRVFSCGLIVNDYWLNDHCVLYEEIQPGSSVSAPLFLNVKALDYCGISQIENFAFQLAISDGQNADSEKKTDWISIPFENTDSPAQPSAADNCIPIYQDETVTIQYKGYDPYDSDLGMPENTQFLLYVENHSDQTLYFQSENSRVDGTACDIQFWFSLPPRSKTVASSNCFDLPVESIAEITEITMDLSVHDETWEETTLSLQLPVALKGAFTQ